MHPVFPNFGEVRKCRIINHFFATEKGFVYLATILLVAEPGSVLKNTRDAFSEPPQHFVEDLVDTAPVFQELRRAGRLQGVRGLRVGHERGRGVDLHRLEFA